MTAELVHHESPYRQPLALRTHGERRYSAHSRHEGNPRISPLPQQTLLVIADEADVRRSIHDWFCRPYKEAANPAVGLEIVSVQPVNVIVADRRSLAAVGIEFQIRVRAEPGKAVRLLLIAQADSKAFFHAVKAGPVYQCASNCSDTLKSDESIFSEMVQAFDTTREGWASAVEPHDSQTDGHSRRVSESVVRLAQAMGMDEAQLVHIRRGGLLHDVGKVGIPDSILGKPGPLTAEEREIMKRHAAYGYELLAPLSFLQEALVIPHCHHERWDGTGYPRGFKGEEIPLAARIFTVIDVWDALCSDRPYRKAWSKHEARAYIRSLAGAHFDPRVVDRFLRLVL
jgi:HD-GYP domain-containing protein (c-di-GMP phosphodiesterase class II)